MMYWEFQWHPCLPRGPCMNCLWWGWCEQTYYKSKEYSCIKCMILDTVNYFRFMYFLFLSLFQGILLLIKILFFKKSIANKEILTSNISCQTISMLNQNYIQRWNWSLHGGSSLLLWIHMRMKSTNDTNFRVHSLP